MSAKDDYSSNYDEKYSEAKRVSSKGTDDDDDVECYDDDKASGGGGGSKQNNCIHVNVLSINIAPSDAVDLSAALDLRISFELDRDVIAGYWVVQFLVDTSSRRVIKVLGQTDVEDYPEGESDMSFYTSQVDISGISPSTLSNSGLLQVIFMADGEEVAYVNMVVNVIKRGNVLLREILNPLD